MTRVLSPMDPTAGGIADSLRELGESMFGNQAKNELTRQQAAHERRKNESAYSAADAFRANNPTELGAQFIVGDRSGPDFNSYNAGRAGIAAGSNYDDPRLATALIAGGHPFSGTPAGQGRELAERGAENDARIAEQRYQFENKPATALDANNNPVYAPQGKLSGGTYRPILTESQATGLMLSPTGVTPAASSTNSPTTGQAPATSSQPAGPATGDQPQSEEDTVPPLPLRPANAPPRNEAFLADLAKANPTRAMFAKLMADYEFDPASPMFRGKGAEMLTAFAPDVKNYDPTWDPSQYMVRMQARKAYAPGGKVTPGLESASKIIGHANDYVNAINAENNYPSGMVGGIIPSAVANAARGMKQDLTQDPSRAPARNSADAVASEAARAFKEIGQSAEQEILEWRHNLSINASPEYAKSSAQSLMKLLASRLEPAAFSYNRTFGTNIQPEDLLSPKARKLYVALKAEMPQQQPAATGQPAQGGAVKWIRRPDGTLGPAQ